MKKIKDIIKHNPIILFDGVCNLCDASVQFILKKDDKRMFLFGTLQSEQAQAFLQSQGQDIKNIDSIILITHQKTYTKSSAALTIAKYLNGLYPLLYVFYVIPKILRDPVYDLIAKNRYRWFGKKESCMVPTPATKGRFL